MHVQQRDWGSISDHRPVRFEVRTTQRLQDMRKRVAKLLFYFPNAVNDAQRAYSAGVDDILKELEQVNAGDEAGAQNFF